MRSTTRYILRQISGPLLFVTLTLTGVIWLTQSLRFIDRIVNNGLSFSSFIYLTMLLMPGVLAIIVPIAIFCATLYVYNRLNSDSELIVLSAVGFNREILSRPAMLMAAVGVIVVLVLNLYLMPLGARTFRTNQYEFRSNLAGVLLQEGVFNTPMSGMTVYIRERNANGEMLGILVHDNHDTRQPITMMAERGTLISTPQGPRLVLVNGNRQQVDAGRRQLSLLYFDSYNIDLDAFGKGEGEGWSEPAERYLSELFYPDMSVPDDRANYNRLIIEGHRRLVSPLYVPTLVLIALAAVLAGEFNRRGQNKRIILAAVAAISLQVLGLGVSQFASRNPILIPLMYLNPLAFAGGAITLLAQVRHPRATSMPQQEAA